MAVANADRLVRRWTSVGHSVFTRTKLSLLAATLLLPVAAIAAPDFTGQPIAAKVFPTSPNDPRITQAFVNLRAQNVITGSPSRNVNVAVQGVLIDGKRSNALT